MVTYTEEQEGFVQNKYFKGLMSELGRFYHQNVRLRLLCAHASFHICSMFRFKFSLFEIAAALLHFADISIERPNSYRYIHL